MGYKLWVFHIPTCTWVHVMPGEPYAALEKEMLRWDIAEIVADYTYRNIPF